jgi:hypothetical protein
MDSRNNRTFELVVEQEQEQEQEPGLDAAEGSGEAAEEDAERAEDRIWRELLLSSESVVHQANRTEG